MIHAYSISQHLLKELRTKLHDRFGVDHLTIQMETTDLKTGFTSAFKQHVFDRSEPGAVAIGYQPRSLTD